MVSLPVPAGINLPTITFSFNPFNVSTLPSVAASVNTLVVSWNDAAEINELVCKYEELFYGEKNENSWFPLKFIIMKLFFSILYKLL